MKRFFGFLAHKKWVLVLSMISLVGLTWLAIGLRHFEFTPVQRLGSYQSMTIRLSLDKVIMEIEGIPAWKQALFWGLLFIIVLLISSLLSAELRKRLLRAFIRFAAFVAIFLYIIRHNPDLLGVLDIFGSAAGAGNPASGSTILPPPVFQPPVITPLVSFLITFGIIILIIGVIWIFNRWWRRKQALLANRGTMEELATIARSSLDDMLGGKDWGNAIIRCYDQMSRVVEKKRGINREISMTPAEFARRLEAAGLPREPVERLTHLFEWVRYGGRNASRKEINEAVACLTSILQFCGAGL